VQLVEVHDFMLPLFLMSLEFAAVGLACSLWKKQNTNKVFILLLFLGCQLFPMTALYYDVRWKDYQTEKRAYESSKVEIIDSLKSRISGLKEQISMVSAELSGVRRERDSNSSAIRQLLLNINRASSQSNKDDMRSEVQNREKLRERREREITDLLRERDRSKMSLREKKANYCLISGHKMTE
jgi:hypothetical protein